MSNPITLADPGFVYGRGSQNFFRSFAKEVFGSFGHQPKSIIVIGVICIPPLAIGLNIETSYLVYYICTSVLHTIYAHQIFSDS